MTTLYIPLSLSADLAMQTIVWKLQYREVVSVKITETSLVIEHVGRPAHEIIAELESCPARLIDV